MLVKEISEKKNIPFADALWQYLGEDLLCRINEAGLKDYIWMGEKELSSDKMKLIYIENKKSMEEASDMILSEETDIAWDGVLEENHQGYVWKLSAKYEDMEVDYPVYISNATGKDFTVPVSMELKPMNPKHRRIHYMVFSSDWILVESLFEIVSKLELIHDMSAYIKASQILKTESISGRYVMEEFEKFTQNNPKIVNEKRLNQLKGYREYGYMRKRWIAASKKQSIEAKWEDALDTIVAFLEPIWNALCNNEIFFDDWMPELGRYLG